MRKILFVATTTGHINIFHMPYLRYFKELGFEVHVASRNKTENDNIEFCDKHYDLPFERFPIKKNNIKAYKELKKIIDDNEYEIIHCHTPVGGVLARLAARKMRKLGKTKVIYTAHGFHFYKGAPMLNWLIYYPIEKIMAHCNDCLITITNEDYEFARNHLKTSTIEHINGVGMTTNRFNNINKGIVNNIRSEYQINEDNIVFSYVAELNKNKNQIVLLETIEKLKAKYQNVKLLLVGEGFLKENYEEEIRKRNLQNNVFLLGGRKEVPEILSITNIYVASSLREGLPVNVMEAMYMGLPIVAISNRGHRELVRNNESGFVVNNKEELCNAIIKLIEDKELREKMGKISNQNVEKYKIENVLEEMKRIYLK